MSVRIPLMLLLAACTTAPHQTPAALVHVLPTPAQTTDDSVVAAVLHKVVVEGLPDWRPRRTVVIQSDSGFVSPSSLPRVDSVDFVLLRAAEIQQLANQLGSVNALSAGRPAIWGDTARSGASSRWVWRQERVGRSIGMSACTFRLRRLNGAWQVDSTLGCVIT